MKEAYFTPPNIAEKSRQMRDLARPQGRGRFDYSPEKSALLVLDMQMYFLDEKSRAYIPSASAILPGLLNLVDNYRQKDHPVVLTRHLNDDSNAAMMDKWWQELIKSENPLSEIDDRFNVHTGELVEKPQYDAFHNTTLEQSLKEKKVTQLVIGGVMTHLCCETTARSAFMRGFEVFFAVDGTATYNEQFHKATLLSLSHGFAELVLIDELIESLNKNDGS